MISYKSQIFSDGPKDSIKLINPMPLQNGGHSFMLNSYLSLSLLLWKIILFHHHQVRTMWCDTHNFEVGVKRWLHRLQQQFVSVSGLILLLLLLLFSVSGFIIIIIIMIIIIIITIIYGLLRYLVHEKSMLSMVSLL